MAALVQTYTPQQPGTVTMLQTRPAGGSGLAVAPGQQYGVPPSNRNSFHGMPGGGSAATPTAYRGSAPIQPYAFTSTPILNRNTPWQHYAARASSTPNLPTMRTLDQSQGQIGSGGRVRHTGNSSNLTYSPSMGLGMTGSRDDQSITRARTTTPTQRPQSAYMTGSQPQVSFAQATPVRPSPDRYRRPSGPQPGRQSSAMPSGSGMSAVGHLYNPHSLSKPAQGQGRPNSLYLPTSGLAVDDTQLYRQPSLEDAAKRLRRRSMHTLDSADYPNPLTPQSFKRPEEMSRVDPSATSKFQGSEKDTKTLRLVPNPAPFASESMRLRNGSNESLVSSRSSNSRPSSSANRNAPGPTAASAAAATSSPSSSHSSISDDNTPKDNSPKPVNFASRASSTDVGKRITNPSPLSRPVTMASDEAVEERLPASNGETASMPVDEPAAVPNPNTESPAARQLAAINKGVKSKSKTSRLRRAFSFGSAAELKKVADAAAANDADSKPEPSKLHKDPSPEAMYETEQARIAKKQEEGGIGNSIYGARLFSGSTDNLSISSTASSASIMIRKMGRGMKRSTRSLVGLFRPKSIVGAPAAEGLAPSPMPADPTATAVSMITAEAERELVNVNPDPHSQAGGGTSFPHLERNSIDASKAPSTTSERVGSSGTDQSGSRRSIVGGDKERAEVLAAVRKGILKKAGTSPTGSLPDNGSATNLPGVPNIADSPNSSAPSTPNDETQGHKRSDSVAIGNEDYFVSALRLRQDSRGGPGMPSSLKRSATFSPRIVFYDTWPSQEYDRRGEIATCNRLTPMLAQQIKEELNTFKMEMEVHENSKIYTHFF